MKTARIEIGEDAHAALLKIAEESGKPIAELVAESVELLSRERYVSRLNEDYAAILADPIARQELEQELEAWEGTVADGLDDV